MYQLKKNKCDIVDYNENLDKLKVLTDALSFSDLVTKNENAKHIEIEAENGNIFAFGLYKSNKVAVSRCYASAGAFMKTHQHDEKEVFIVYDGNLTIEINNKYYTLDPTDIFYIEPNTPHSVKFNEETWSIVLTIPASEHFPEGLQ